MTNDNQDALRCADALNQAWHDTLRCADALNQAWHDGVGGQEMLTAEKHLQRLVAESEAKDALLRQVLNDVCGAKLCEVNSMSSRAEARRLLDRAIAAIRQHLEG